MKYCILLGKHREKLGKNYEFLKKIIQIYTLICYFPNISEIRIFYPNLRLRVCLAMCLIFQHFEPSVLINRMLTEEKMCKTVGQSYFWPCIYLIHPSMSLHEINSGDIVQSSRACFV